MNGFSSLPLILPNETVIRVEANPLERSEDQDVAFKAIQDPLHVDDLRGAIEGIGQLVVDSFRKLGTRKASAEFGIEVGLESGQLTALWVKGTGKANLKITLEWENSSADYDSK